MGGWVLDILNAVAAKRTAPMRLGIGVVLLHNALIHGQRFVEFTNAAEIVAAVERSRPLVIVNFGECHGTAAAFADAKGFVLRNFNVAATHFTFNNCHVFHPLSIYFRLTYGSMQIQGSSAIFRCGCVRPPLPQGLYLLTYPLGYASTQWMFRLYTSFVELLTLCCPRSHLLESIVIQL